MKSIAQFSAELAHVVGERATELGIALGVGDEAELSHAIYSVLNHRRVIQEQDRARFDSIVKKRLDALPEEEDRVRGLGD